MFFRQSCIVTKLEVSLTLVVKIFRKNPGDSISVLHLMNCPGDFYRFCIAVWFVLADVITFYHGFCVKSYFFRQKMSYLRNV